MEAGVLFDVRLVRRDPALLRAEELAQLGELCRRDARGGEGRDRRLDDAAELDDVRDRVTTGDE